MCMGSLGRVVELFRFEDDYQSVAVEVNLGGVAGVAEDYYSAEIVAKSDFVNRRVGLAVTIEDLDAWERCLDALGGVFVDGRAAGDQQATGDL